MCNCINQTLEKVKEHLLDSLPENYDESTFTADFQNRVFRFDGKNNDVMLGINYEYYRKKEDGTRYKNKTKDSISLAMSYCPMCGEEYKETDE